MATIKVELSGEKELQRALARAGDKAIDAIGAAMYVEAEAVMAESNPLVPADQSVLRNSGFVRLPERTPTGVSVTLGYGGAASGYAVYVHEGTGPAVGRPAYFPPPSALAGWAARVLGDANLAFVVARGIGQRGTKPTKFLERPLLRRASTMAERIAAFVRRRLGRKL